MTNMTNAFPDGNVPGFSLINPPPPLPLQIRVSNLMSGSIGKATVKALSVTPKEGGAAVAKDLVFESTANP